MAARLTSEVWVAAYLTRCRLADIPAFIVARGDHTAGAVMVKLNTLDGKACCYHRSFDIMTGERRWVVHIAGNETDVDVSIGKQRTFDSDLWVIEIEDREGRHLLDDPSLA